MSSLLDQETLALIDPAILHREVEIACGAHREDKNFRTMKAPFAALLDGLLGTFRVGDKDGLCILSGGLVTPSGCQRIAKNVTRNHLMMFDHDTGVPVEEICAKIEALGYFAVVYTTYSHLKPATEVAESQVTKWLTKSGKKAGNDGSITPEQAADFLRENKKIVPEILADISRVERVMVAGKGVVYRITHAPMPRCRSVLVLKDPFDFAQRGTQAQAIAEWKEKYTRVAALIDGTFDSSCTDPSRLMYTPVKAADAAPGTHEWYVVPGAMLDLRHLPPALDPVGDRFSRFREQGGTEDAVRLDLKTPNLAEFLRQHADDFEAQEWLLSVAPEDLRDNKGDRIAFCCPNEDNHTEINPQDQAFVTWNASSRPDGHGFHMLCMHDTCKTMSHDKRAWYLDLLCQKYGVEDAMELRAFCPRWEEEQETQEEARDELAERIDGVNRDTPETEINTILEVLATLPIQDVRTGALVQRLIANSRFDRATIMSSLSVRRRDNARRAENSVPGGDAAAGNTRADPLPDNPERATVIYDSWGHPDQCLITEKRFCYLNKKDPSIFVRREGGRVYLQHTGMGATLKEHPRDDSTWACELTRRKINFIQRTPDWEEVSVPPFANVVSYIKGNPDLDLPTIERIVNVPVFSPSGTLKTAKGYDKECESFLDPNAEYFPVSKIPTPDEVEDARYWLFEALRDFPFTDCFEGADPLPIRRVNADGSWSDVDEEGFPLPNLERGKASRAHAIAMILQPFVRNMINGPCPNYHIDKPERGTGAGYLVDVAWWIFHGGRAVVQTMDQGREEIKKAITTTLREGASILFLDNIEQKVDSPDIAAALTAGTWRARILGVTENVTIPIRCTWIMAGNRVPFSLDMMRRNVPIFIDAATPNPASDRKANYYKHHPLHEWLASMRPTLVWACHTLIANWIAQGAPRGTGEMQSFSEWAGVMSGILETNEIDGFLDSRAAYTIDRGEDNNVVDLVTRRVWQKLYTKESTIKDVMAAILNPFGAGVVPQPDPDLGLTLVGRDEASVLQSLGRLITQDYLGKTVIVDEKGTKVTWTKRKTKTGVKYQIVELVT